MTIRDIPGIRLSGDYLDIPSHIKHVKIDVGLSWCAPNSAAWLARDGNNETFVIGIEANRFACQRLGSVVLNPHRPRYRADITDQNYMLLNCAIDNVSDLEMRMFYHVGGDPGTSSLLKPTPALKERHGLVVEEESLVPTISLAMLLALIPWDRYGFITHMKTDCQGKDLDVILSANEYLGRIVYLDCEVATNGLYEGELDSLHIIQSLEQQGFRLLSRKGANASFINAPLGHLAHERKLTNYTVRR